MSFLDRKIVVSLVQMRLLEIELKSRKLDYAVTIGETGRLSIFGKKRGLCHDDEKIRNVLVGMFASFGSRWGIFINHRQCDAGF